MHVKYAPTMLVQPLKWQDQLYEIKHLAQQPQHLYDIPISTENVTVFHTNVLT